MRWDFRPLFGVLCLFSCRLGNGVRREISRDFDSFSYETLYDRCQVGSKVEFVVLATLDQRVGYCC